MRSDNKIALLGSAGALVMLLAWAPAQATEQRPSNGQNQAVHTVTLRAAAKVQTDIIKYRVQAVRHREMRDRAK